MLKINFKGIIPQSREYSYSVKENNKTNKIKFIVEKVQDDVDLSLYTPYLKLETPLKDYVDKINTGLVVSSDTNYVYIVWNMPRKATAYQNLNVQLQFQKAEGGTSTDTLVWQSAICTLELQNTIKADAEIADKNPEKIIEIENELENHEDRIAELEEHTGGGEWGEIEGNIADQTDLVTLINTNVAPKANKTYVDAQDQALSDDIDDEQQARIDADNDLSDDIDAEETARQNADTALQEQITSLSQRDRFLSGWNCMTGLPTTNPTTPLPYAYKRGDHYTVKFVDYVSQYEEYDTETAYLVGDKCKVTVGGVATYYICIENTQGTFDATAWQVKQLANIKNYRPSGSSYTGVASTVVETEPVAPNDVYQFDGTVWTLFFNTQKTVGIENVTGLTEALAGKAGKAENNAFSGNNTHSGTETFTNKVYFSSNGHPNIQGSGDTITIDGYGSAGKIYIKSPMLPSYDNATDIGSTTNRIKDVYLSGKVYTNDIDSSDVLYLGKVGYETRTRGGLSPSLNNAYDLGKTTLKWKDLYLSGNIYSANIYCGSIIPNVNDYYNLGLSTNKFKDLYLNGIISDGTNSATVYQLTNGVLGMVAPSSTNLTDAEYAELTNGKPHQLIGTFSGYQNIMLTSAVLIGGSYRGIFIANKQDYAWQTIGKYDITTSKVVSFSYNLIIGNNSKASLYDLGGVNGKNVPAYPSNSENKRLVCYGGTLSYVDDANVITDASATTFSGAMSSGNLYKFSTPLTSLNPSAYNVATNDLQPCWAVMFKVGATFTAPSTVTIKWRDDDAPSFESGKTYIITILQGIESSDYLGSYQEF